MWHTVTVLSYRPLKPEPSTNPLTCKHVAEREGFEPPGRLHDRLLSRQLQSTRLCHRSQTVRRRQGDRPASVQALSYQVLGTFCGKDIQPAPHAAGHEPDVRTMARGSAVSPG